MSRYLKISLIFILFFISGCSSVGTVDESSIKKYHSESLADNYTNLKIQYFDSDVGVSIYTYIVEKNFSLAELKQKILNKKYDNLPSFKIAKDETEEGKNTELILRQELIRSNSYNFNEYRILFNKDKKRITIMYANMDSSHEKNKYESFLKKQDSIHEQN